MLLSRFELGLERPAGTLASKLVAISPPRAEPKPVSASDGLNLVVTTTTTTHDVKVCVAVALSLFFVFSSVSAFTLQAWVPGEVLDSEDPAPVVVVAASHDAFAAAPVSRTNAQTGRMVGLLLFCGEYLLRYVCAVAGFWSECRSERCCG